MKNNQLIDSKGIFWFPFSFLLFFLGLSLVSDSIFTLCQRSKSKKNKRERERKRKRMGLKRPNKRHNCALPRKKQNKKQQKKNIKMERVFLCSRFAFLLHPKKKKNRKSEKMDDPYSLSSPPSIQMATISLSNWKDNERKEKKEKERKETKRTFSLNATNPSLNKFKQISNNSRNPFI